MKVNPRWGFEVDYTSFDKVFITLVRAPGPRLRRSRWPSPLVAGRQRVRGRLLRRLLPAARTAHLHL